MAKEKQKPLTREDVLRLIKENGGTAKGLDLSGKAFEAGIDLRGLNLKGIILNKTFFPAKHEIQDFRISMQPAQLQGANLMQAQLQKADLALAQLQGANLMAAELQEAHLLSANLQGASLRMAQLQGAYLGEAQLQGAELYRTNLEGAYLWGTKFSPETRLEQTDWGNFILGEEVNRRFGRAVDTYRWLKIWHTNAGMYDIAGKFFYREMEATRKAQSWKKKPHLKLWSWVLRLLCGYGEKPLRVIVWAASVMVGLALIYFIIGSVWAWSAFWNSLYFSAVSFTALGYGSWLEINNDWIRGIGAFESFIGVFSIALFLITFVRKMTR